MLRGQRAVVSQNRPNPRREIRPDTFLLHPSIRTVECCRGQLWGQPRRQSTGSRQLPRIPISELLVRFLRRPTIVVYLGPLRRGKAFDIAMRSSNCVGLQRQRAALSLKIHVLSTPTKSRTEHRRRRNARFVAVTVELGLGRGHQLFPLSRSQQY